MKIDYVIHGVNENPLYADFWDMVSEIWTRNFRVTPVLFKISDKDTDFYTDRHGGLVKEIKGMDGMDTGFQSQIVRLFGCAWFPEHTCLISDIDMLPISRDYFCHNAAPHPDDALIIYSADAYPHDRRYPMCYALAKGRTFGEVLDLPPDFHDFAKRLFSRNWEWYTDERYLFECVQNWKGRKVLLKRGWTNAIAHNRLDRAFWYFHPQDIMDGGLYDCHSLRPIAAHGKTLDGLKSAILKETAPARGRKLISFSLWGGHPKYTTGALKNAALAPIIYPGWTCRFYVTQSVPREIVSALAAYPHVEVVELTADPEREWEALLFRYYPMDEPDVDVVIFRDTDSRLTLREKAAVDAWRTSPLPFHIMRDHPLHQLLIMGGMFGARGGIFREIKPVIRAYLGNNQDLIKYGIDQQFLADIVYPLIQDRAMVHDEILSNKPFPLPRQHLEFVGQIFLEDDSTPVYGTTILERYLHLRRQSLAHRDKGYGLDTVIQPPSRVPVSDAQIQAHLEAGLAHQRSGKWMAADTCYRKIIEWRPDHAEAWHFSGVTAYERDDHTTAIQRLNRAIQLNPDNPFVHYNLGNALTGSGKREEAIAAFEKAIALKPDFPQGYNNLGILLLAQNRLDEAEACFRKSLALHPDNPQAMNSLAVIQQKKGDAPPPA